MGVKWTEEEENALRAGVAEKGKGKWAEILKDSELARHLSRRSNIDLKDKWRNMEKAAEPAATSAHYQVPGPLMILCGPELNPKQDFQWEDSSIETSPQHSLLLTSAYHLCNTHGQLISRHIQPEDDIYNQLPSVILEKRRPNGQKGLHILYTKRHLEGETVSRRLGNPLIQWVENSCVEVFGLKGELVGHKFSLHLYFHHDGSIMEGKWNANEFVSVECVNGDSAVVELKCEDPDWKKVEIDMENAESDLLEAYVNKMFVEDSEANLRVCISDLIGFRKKFREDEELQLHGGGMGSADPIVDDLVGSSPDMASSTGINLSLRLGPVAEELHAASHPEIVSEEAVALSENIPEQVLHRPKQRPHNSSCIRAGESVDDM